MTETHTTLAPGQLVYTTSYGLEIVGTVERVRNGLVWLRIMGGRVIWRHAESVRPVE